MRGNLDKLKAAFNVQLVAETAQIIMVDPQHFYTHMAVTGGYGEPLRFVTTMGAISTLFALILGMVGLGGFGTGLVPLWTSLLLPVIFVVASFIAAGLMHSVWHLMGSDQDYETSYRCVAYSSALFPLFSLVNLVPYLGTAINTIWWLGLMVIASYTVHQILKKKAVLVLTVLGILILSIGLSEEKVERQSTARLEAFNDQMEKLQKKSLDLN